MISIYNSLNNKENITNTLEIVLIRRLNFFFMTLLLWQVCFVSAQTFPNKPITLVVPTSPGGPNDMAARIIAKQLAIEIGQPIIVINRPGASQKIGVESVMSSPKDGYTIGIVSPASMIYNPALEKNLGYDPVNDFTQLINAIEYQSVLVINPSIPAKNMAEFVAYARSRPDVLTYGSGGGGSSIHFTTAAFLSLTGIKALHVPYKSSGPAQLGLLGGEVNMLLPDLGDIKSYIATGQVTALAISGSVRSKLLPNVPTFSETGLPELKNWNYSGWIGVVAPSGIPKDISLKLQSALQATMKSASVKEAFDNIGFKVIASPAEEFKKQIQEGLEMSRKIAKEGNITK
jgi:tripartite-type tricarboxylate transporter receptor subunit TctC